MKHAKLGRKEFLNLVGGRENIARMGMSGFRHPLSLRYGGQAGEDLAEEVRKYHIPDFSHWKNHDAFERAFARLEKDLRTSIL